MAGTPISSQWFLQWSPPNEIFSLPYLQQPSQPTNIVHQRNSDYGLEFQPPNTFTPSDPYRGYQQESFIDESRDLTPGAYILNGPRGYQSSSGLDNSQEVFSNDNTGFGDFHGALPYSQSEQLTPWGSKLIPKNNKKNKVPNVPTQATMVRLLPYLVAAGLVNSQKDPPQRGDQIQNTPDPDRDLGGAPPLRTLYHWRLMDFEFDSEGSRMAALDSKEFIPENTLPLGMEVWKDRVFVTFPRWKSGVPCTLGTVPRAPPPSLTQPRIKPYPDWSWHAQQGDCLGLTSVFRISADKCGRLWILDSGQVDALTVPRQICPPQIVAFDLNTDRLVGRWPIPEEHVRQNSLFTNIVTDIRDDKCDDIHIYFTDVWRFALLVFRMRDQKFWRFNSHLFYPDPLASDYTLHGINFQWSDGVFGISMTPVNKQGDRTLYFHAMSSYREFQLPVSLLRNETAANDTAVVASSITLAGESRGCRGQSSASAIARNGVMFYNLVLRDAVGCWDTRKPYKKTALNVVARDEERLNFPNDLKIDNEEKQSVWILSNKLPTFIYRSLNPNVLNFRIMREYVDEAIAGSVCDPRHRFIGSSTFEPECH